jgi:hypothetical protein
MIILNKYLAGHEIKLRIASIKAILLVIKKFLIATTLIENRPTQTCFGTSL